MALETVLKFTFFGLFLKIDQRPSKRKNPQSSSIKQLEQTVHRFIQATKRDREALIYYVMLQPAHIWPVKLSLKHVKSYKWLYRAP